MYSKSKLLRLVRYCDMKYNVVGTNTTLTALRLVTLKAESTPPHTFLMQGVVSIASRHSAFLF